MRLFNWLFRSRKINQNYINRKSDEAHAIKSEIQSVISETRTKMRMKKRELNNEFNKLDMAFLDASQRIALATGQRRSKK